MKTLGLAAALTMGTALGANAALIDFTAPSAGAIAGNVINGAGWTLEGFGGQLNYANNAPGAAASPLAGNNDGLGIADDEATSGQSQFYTITFDRAVTITGLYFLDLFIDPNNGVAEQAVVTGDAAGAFDALVDTSSDAFGFAEYTGLALAGTTFTFTPANTNDNLGDPDFALAGITFETAPIPLPAGVVLLGGALAGLGFARRKS